MTSWRSPSVQLGMLPRSLRVEGRERRGCVSSKKISRPNWTEPTCATIAARHRIKPRWIQRLFEREDMTFTEYVLAQRLARAHRLLADPRYAGQKISTIAFNVGFGDLSYFNRAFRRRYGAAPSELRAAARCDD